MRVCACMCARACVRNFDTITCTCRCERAVIFACTLRVRGVTEAKRGRYASGACVCVNFMHPEGAYVIVLRVHVHVSAPCGCVISFSKRTLRFAPRLVKPPFGWVRFAPKNKIIFIKIYNFGNFKKLFILVGH